MNIFFDENGIINLNETVMKMESFRKILEDGIITDSELAQQTDRYHFLCEYGYFRTTSCADNENVVLRLASSDYPNMVLVRQSNLEDKALSIAEEVIANNKNASSAPVSATKSFCSRCDHKLPDNAIFRPYCEWKR